MRVFQLLPVLIAAWCSGSCAEAAPRIAVIAHRGAAAQAPENSLAAIDAAVKMGCRIVEVDVRLSQDGRAVLLHDATVDRTTNGRGRVDGLTFAQLRELDAGVHYSKAFRDTKIPLLEEAIDLVRGRAMLYLDLKLTDLEPVVRLVRQAEFSKSVFYRVYRPADVDRLRQLDPGASVIIDVGQLGLLPGAIDVVLARNPETILSVDLGAITEESQARLKRGSSRWFVNVLGSQTSPSELRRAIDLGPTAIMTDTPRVLLDLLR